LVDEALVDEALVDAAGVEGELDALSELDFEPLSPEEDEAPSLELDPPSLELDPPSFEPLSDLGADEDLDG